MRRPAGPPTRRSWTPTTEAPSDRRVRRHRLVLPGARRAPLHGGCRRPPDPTQRHRDVHVRRAHAQRREPHVRDVRPHARRSRRPGDRVLHARRRRVRGRRGPGDHRRDLPAAPSRDRRRRQPVAGLIVSATDILDLVGIVPLLPLLGAAVLLVFGRRLGEPAAGWLATTMLALSFVWSVVTFFALSDLPEHARSHTVNLFTFLQSGGLDVQFGFLVDPLSVTFILFVTGIATLIHIFSVGYMHGDERFARFFAYLNLFVASMLLLVLGSSFLVTFIGWEGVGLCSYLLIGFWFEREGASVASKK